MKPRFAAVWTLEPSWTTPIAPRHTAAYSLPAQKLKRRWRPLTEKARSVESEPCQITPTFTEESGGVRLDIDFVFACEAETLIFQLGLR
ncbi:putative cytoplasmic protein [Salmonella bongori]|nr:putative cytoplasmic protein [Salmonella bongori]